MSDRKVALVTGANRGIGFEICRQLAEKGVEVILSARNQESGQQAADQLSPESGNVTFLQLDVTSEFSIQAAFEYLSSNVGKLDILVNNAGMIINNDSTLTVKKADFQATLETNFFGPLLISQRFLPLLKKSSSGRIINISSGMGALNEMGSGHAAYRLSKTILNGLTTAMAADLSGTSVTVNSMCPGWVKTRLGTDAAPRTPAQGAETAVWLAITNETPTGQFFRDQHVIDW